MSRRALPSTRANHALPVDGEDPMLLRGEGYAPGHCDGAAHLKRLTEVLGGTDRWLIAVSGGVDSMTLATVAHRTATARMVHATSPAVPPAATARVRASAAANGWALTVLDAGEFADPDYRANPANRCYFCKRSLYGALTRELGAIAGEAAIAAGTNCDDLSDIRPGLTAAAEAGVRHPLVEAGIDKAGVRAIAVHLGLSFAALPAAPCLSSRVETGIAINADDLRFIDALETALRRLTSAPTLRVRLRRGGVRVETDAPDADWPALGAVAESACREAGRVFVGVASYARGSAFLR